MKTGDCYYGIYFEEGLYVKIIDIKNDYVIYTWAGKNIQIRINNNHNYTMTIADFISTFRYDDKLTKDTIIREIIE